VHAEAVGDLTHALDRLLASLAHDLRCAEFFRECDAVGMAPQDDDLLGAEAPGGDHAAQADGAVPDDGHRLPGTDLRGDSGVMARPHHVCERQKRRHQRLVGTDRQDNERPVCLRDAHRFGLCSLDVLGAEEPSVDARGVEPLAAEETCAVGVGEGHDDDIADLHGADVGAHGFDDADGLVAHPAAGVAVFHGPVRPEIAAADGGAVYGDQGVRWFG
jgi:hypothetical protein